MEPATRPDLDGGIQFRPEADLFPLLTGDEFEELSADIAENGLQQPIILHQDGRILDGRNRYRACIDAGIEPTFETWTGEPGTEVEFVVSLNLRRRHLNESQRGAVAAEIANWQFGMNQHTGGSANLPTPVSQARAAEMLNVSERTVRTAKAVKDEAPSNVYQLVRSGDLSLNKAAVAAKAEPDAKAAIAAAKNVEEVKELISQVAEAKQRKDEFLATRPSPKEAVRQAVEQGGGVSILASDGKYHGVEKPKPDGHALFIPAYGTINSLFDVVTAHPRDVLLQACVNNMRTMKSVITPRIRETAGFLNQLLKELGDE